MVSPWDSIVKSVRPERVCASETVWPVGPSTSGTNINEGKAEPPVEIESGTNSYEGKAERCQSGRSRERLGGFDGSIVAI